MEMLYKKIFQSFALSANAKTIDKGISESKGKEI
jgi:hypothetical protein